MTIDFLFRLLSQISFCFFSLVRLFYLFHSLFVFLYYSIIFDLFEFGWDYIFFSRSIWWHVHVPRSLLHIVKAEKLMDLHCNVWIGGAPVWKLVCGEVCCSRVSLLVFRTIQQPVKLDLHNKKSKLSLCDFYRH